MPGDVIDPVYLPFTAEELLEHFAPVPGDEQRKDPQRHLKYYLTSAKRYHSFQRSHPERKGQPLSAMKVPCQIEKDERFWVAACLMKCFRSASPVSAFSALLSRAFGSVPPVSGFASWEAALRGNLHLFFEVSLPSPAAYREWLRENLTKRQLIPYVLNAAYKGDSNRIRTSLEGPTHLDALLLNEQNGFAVFFEAKVLSDTSHSISFDVARNQIARNVDVMLEPHPGLPRPLNQRDPARTLFALLTPRYFREHPGSRHYGVLLPQYQADPASLGRDIAHRSDVDWPEVSRRLGWLTFEDCQEVEPGACRWLWRDRCGICNRLLEETGPQIPYPSFVLVCSECDGRALNEQGERARHASEYPEWDGVARRAIEEANAKGEKVDLVMPPDDGDNPVFIDAVKCWRRYRFGGWVTFRDLFDCQSLAEFYDTNERVRFYR